jgi:peroxiredoxin Q/BCP
MRSVKIKTWRALAIAVAAGSLVTAAIAAQGLVPGQPDLKVGDQAPDFTLQASDGQTYTLSKLKGRSVVLAWFPKAFTAG